jgi:gamma-glutamyl:cysteine ligase YbdK (ATP-grasp superfamily)
MRQIKLTGTISSDHKLSVDVPPDVPVGTAEVIVRVSDSPKAEKPNDLASFMDWLDKQPRCTRSKEEIDRYLEEERNSWERNDVRDLPR